MERQHVEIHNNTSAFDALSNIVEHWPDTLQNTNENMVTCCAIEGFFKIVERVDWESHLYNSGMNETNNSDLVARDLFLRLLKQNMAFSDIRGQYVAVPIQNNSTFIGIGYVLDNFFIDLHIRVGCDVESDGNFVVVILHIQRKMTWE